MRAVEQQVQTTFIQVSNGPAVGPGVAVNWQGTGIYDIRLTEPGAKFVAVVPLPTPGATQFQFNGWPLETPPRIQIQFLNAAGAAGNFGGAMMVLWRKQA